MQATKQKMSPSWCVMLTLKRSDCKLFFQGTKISARNKRFKGRFPLCQRTKQRKVRKYAQINLTDTQSSILLPLWEPVSPLCAIFRERVEVVTHNGRFAPCWGNVKDWILPRTAKNTRVENGAGKRDYATRGGIIRETPTGRAVGRSLVWHNFSRCHQNCYAMGDTLFILLYFLNSMNRCIGTSVALCKVRKED